MHPLEAAQLEPGEGVRKRSRAFDSVAQELIAKTVAGRAKADRVGRAINEAFRRLECEMAAMVGDVGAHALFVRALHLTAKEGVDADLPTAVAEGAPPGGWAALAERSGTQEACAAATLLFCNVLELLASFIGEDLTFRLVRRAFEDLGDAGADGDQES